MSVPICHHLKEDGVYCGSPALKDRDYCYFHLNLRGRRLKAARARRRGDNPPLNLPFPEDMHAVQVSLAEILWAVAEHRIDRKDAGIMLYTLQLASTNLNQTPRWQGERTAVENTRPLRALSDPGFEQRFDLPAHADLDTLPKLDDAPPIDLPTSVILSEEVAIATDESKEPFMANERPVPVGECGTGQGAPPLSPDSGDRVGTTPEPDYFPLPAEQRSQLKMTQAEEMQFFNYRMSRNTPGDEDKLKLIWLCAKRAGMLTQTEEDRENSAAFEKMFPEPAESGESEAA